MGDLELKISDQIKSAMKAKDKIRLNALRYIKKLLIENKTSNKPISEQDVVISYAKKVKDSLAMYPEGSEQKNEINLEIKVLEEFLPQQLTQSEVEAIIDDIYSKLDSPNMGAVMKELSGQIKGKFDGKLASDLVKAKLKS